MMNGKFLFDGYSKTGKRIQIYLDDFGHVQIWYMDTVSRRRWNDEYYTEDDSQIIRFSLISEGFRFE